VILDFIDDDGAMMPVRHVSFDIRKHQQANDPRLS